jgi:general secretion pathway protein C
MKKLLQSAPLLVLAVVAILMLLSLAYQGYRFSQDVVSAQTATEAAPIKKPVLPARGQSSNTNLSQLNLFGDSNAKEQEIVAAPTQDLPKTNLRITLRGVTAATKEDRGMALIEGPDKKTERYHVSDTLPGNAKLHAVMADRVVIARGGVFESLYFPEDADSGNIEFYAPEPDPDGYQEQAYEEPQYEEPTYPEPQYQDNSSDGGEQATEPEPQSPVGSISEDRKEEIRKKLEELRQRMKVN